MKQRSFLHILGIDLGGGKGKKTAVATLRVDQRDGGATVVDIAPRGGTLPLYDQTLLELLGAFGDGTLICVDAPLTLPPCLRCQVPVCPGQELCSDSAVVEMRRLTSANAAPGDRDGRRGKPSITPYTQRATEVHLFFERGFNPREALGQGTGPLAARAAPRRDNGAGCRFPVYSDLAATRDLDVVFISVPTPVDRAKQPDLSFIINAAEGLAPHLHAGQLVILEVDTTSPPFNDLRARQALAYATNRKGILDAAYVGFGVVSPAHVNIPTTHPAFTQAPTPHPLHRQEAKQLLAAVSYPA